MNEEKREEGTREGRQTSESKRVMRIRVVVRREGRRVDGLGRLPLSLSFSFFFQMGSSLLFF